MKKICTVSLSRVKTIAFSEEDIAGLRRLYKGGDEQVMAQFTKSRLIEDLMSSSGGFASFIEDEDTYRISIPKRDD